MNHFDKTGVAYVFKVSESKAVSKAAFVSIVTRKWSLPSNSVTEVRFHAGDRDTSQLDLSAIYTQPPIYENFRTQKFCSHYKRFRNCIRQNVFVYYAVFRFNSLLSVGQLCNASNARLHNMSFQEIAKLLSEYQQDPPIASCIARAFSRVSVAAETARLGLIF